MLVTTESPATAVRSRDASATRQLLLAAARRHFARDGYTTATVRDIATEAGVNVALISRYFESKEGLFEACIMEAAEGFTRPEFDGVSLDRIIVTILREVAAFPSGDSALQLMLLLRTSGDDRADGVRRKALEGFSQRMAIASGVEPSHPDFPRTVLRAQIALAATIGLVVLRSSTAIEPLTSATEDELAGPVRELLEVLLAR
jgi:AcrR family transcriptional regulator